MRKKYFIIIFFIIMIFNIIACGNSDSEDNTLEDADNTYESVTAEDAKKIIDTTEDYIILDVRTQSEYDDGHIEDAVLIPYDEIEDRYADELPDKDQVILVYCRSGNRSKTASTILVELGYTNVIEFGGIIDWPYDIVTE